MKSKITILAALFSLLLNAQQGVNYKAVISENGAVIQNQIIAVYFTILEDGTTNVFEENHTVATDANGIIILNIGEGVVTSGDFTLVDWSKEQFLKVEVNAGSGITNMGTTMFKAVPYALYAKKTEETVFTTTNNVTSNIRGDITTDGFVFGDTQLDGSGTKMFFNKTKGAFRVGNSYSTDWDDVNIGQYSFATGDDVIARGTNSVSLGFGNQSNGDYSTTIGAGSWANADHSIVIGTQSFAEGYLSMVFGNSSNAIGLESIAIGSLSKSHGVASMAIGFDNDAYGDYSLAIGQSTDAHGENSIALGHQTYAYGFASLATGRGSLTNGNFSSALGYAHTTESYAQTSLGMNSTEVMGTVDSYVATDRLFVIGNGTSSTNRSDAMVVLKNGNTTLNGNLDVIEVNALDSGDADMKAYIYGLITGGSGAIKSASSDGFTVNKTSTGTYQVIFANPPSSFTEYMVVSSLHGTIGFVKTIRNTTNIAVNTYNTSGVLSDSDFNFVVYKK